MKSSYHIIGNLDPTIITPRKNKKIVLMELTANYPKTGELDKKIINAIFKSGNTKEPPFYELCTALVDSRTQQEEHHI